MVALKYSGSLTVSSTIHHAAMDERPEMGTGNADGARMGRVIHTPPWRMIRNAFIMMLLDTFFDLFVSQAWGHGFMLIEFFVSQARVKFFDQVVNKKRPGTLPPPRGDAPALPAARRADYCHSGWHDAEARPGEGRMCRMHKTPGKNSS